jgi:hypothetical protein
MCVIAYKPLNVAFPEENYLKNCFENNSHGAGFMYAFNGNVHFQKGYTTFDSFKSALDKARKITGDKAPYVMHFRIATQGFEKTMTHPFPLSSNMKKLKKLRGDCNIGVAHNGILDITSDGSKEYSDTMKFITDYLSLIIRNYSWWKDDRTKLLIERLIDGSRLAILDKNGHCEILGKGWVENNGVYYSNESYSYKKEISVWTPAWEWEDDYPYGHWTRNNCAASNKPKPQAQSFYNDPYEDFYNPITGKYEFEEGFCPYDLEDDDSYCEDCANCHKCPYIQKVVNIE